MTMTRQLLKRFTIQQFIIRGWVSMLGVLAGNHHHSLALFWIRPSSPRTTTIAAYRCHNSLSTHRELCSKALLYSDPSDNLWSIEKCLKYFDEPDVHFVDVSWYHKRERNGRQEFVHGPRIPGAQYWDMDDVATSQALFPHLNPKDLRVMFPPKSLIYATLQAMNIRTLQIDPGDLNQHDTVEREKSSSTHHGQIILYGRRGCLFPPRVWYTLKTFGHSKVALMQGSLEDWKEAGGPVDETIMDDHPFWSRDIIIIQSEAYQEAQDFFSTQDSNGKGDKLDRSLDMEDMLQHAKKKKKSSVGDGRQIRLFDTRGPKNYHKGHVPGSISIPYRSLVEEDNPLKFKSREDLRKILRPHLPEDDDGYDVWLSCGSGVSVCHLALALEECGYRQKPYIYDGSWNEWGSEPDTPKEISEATNT